MRCGKFGFVEEFADDPNHFGVEIIAFKDFHSAKKLFEVVKTSKKSKFGCPQ